MIFFRYIYINKQLLFMRRTDIKSILLINKYLTKCKLSEPNSHKTEMVKSYLLKRVDKTLNNK